MKLPFVKRERYESALSKNAALRRQRNELELELKLSKRVAEQILPRLLKIREPLKNTEFQQYRICVDLHRDMVERAFTYGGDEHTIRYTARLLAHEIERKMIQFNFARCDG